MEHRVVTEGLAFPEGPLELPGGDLLVTEIRTGVLTRVKPDGTKSTFATVGGGPNGLALGPDGAVYVAQNGGFEWTARALPEGGTAYTPGERPKDYTSGAIQRVTMDGAVSVIYRDCDGEPLKGPNDLVFDREGNFYFTDMGKSYGRQLDRTGVYYASPDGKMIREIVFPMERPNGIALSPDERTLYIAETPTARVWACELAAPGEIKSRRILATVTGVPPMNQALLDSMCVDAEGNVVVATLVRGGVTSISPDGSRQEFTPSGDGMTTNACFGGAELRTLYVTCSGRGQLIAFDDWPTKGLRLNSQA